MNFGRYRFDQTTKTKTKTKNNMAKLNMSKTKKNEIANTTDLPPALSGEWSSSDISIPKLSLVQATSSMDEFSKGSLVYDRQVEVCTKDEVVEVSVLTMHKYFEEDVEYGSDQIPERWEAEADARAAGVNHKWDRKPGRSYSERCDVVFLVPVPMEHAHYEFEGVGYVKCLYTFKSTAYNLAKRLFTATNGANAGGLPYALRWDLGSEMKTNGQNKWFVPSLVNKGKADEGLLNYLVEEVI